MHSSSFTVEATTMGFSEKEIREAFLKQIAEHEATFANFATLIDTILTLQLTNSPILTSTPESQHNDRLSTSTETGMSSNIPPHKSAIQELHELKQMSLCKKCFQSKASVVILPCGHLSVCKNRSKECSQSPICKVHVRDKIQTYIV